MKVKYQINKNMILSVLIIWIGILLVMYDVPGLLSLIKFSNNEMIKYSIIDGYADEYTIQSDIICNTSMIIISIVSHFIIVMFSIASIIKLEMTKIIGVVIFVQNFICICLQLWEKVFTNNINKVYFNILPYLGLVIIITVALVCLSLTQKFYYILFVIITVLQSIKFLRLLIENFGHILEIGILNMLCYCGNYIIIIILFWLLVFVQHKYNQHKDLI